MKQTWLQGTLILILAGMVTHARAEDMMSVQVRESAIRTTPSFLGKVQAKVAYADRVTVLGEKAPWIKVKTADGAEGWMNKSALSPKKIVLKAGKGEVNTGASSEELALAGKGFNSQVEAEFKAKHATANFDAVDRMEKRSANQADVVVFLDAGGVKPATKEGGAK